MEVVIQLLSGEADPEVEEISGQKINNIKMILSLAPIEDDDDLETLKPGQFATLGVIHEEGRRVTMKGQTGLGSLIKITEQELEELLNDWDPIEAPPGDYKGRLHLFLIRNTMDHLVGGGVS